MEGAKIQIVEDEAVIALGLKTKVEALGYTVTSIIATGEEAILAAGRDMPALVLMDIVLRGKMDGVEAAKEIKDRHAIPIIYMTAYSGEKILERAQLTEPSGYLLKACTNTELMVTIKMSLYKHKMEEWRRKAEEAERKRQEEKILIEQAKLSAMGEMLRAIAHNWRQPLNALGLIIQDVEDSYKFGEFNDEYLSEFVSNSMAEINSMSEVINGYRNLFKPDKEKRPFDAVEAVGETCSFLHGQTRNLSVNVEIIHPGIEALFVTGYINEFRQVVLNLMFNSMDAITARKKALRLTQNDTVQEAATIGNITLELSRHDTMAMLKITDDGGGVPEGLANRIFEPYFTTREQGSGVGVGLYLSKILIENQMDGKLYFENVENGAAFYVMLPETSEPCK
ncbi:MAG: response regulator [Nitrospirae bacterium]|nr:response regulator [Nitrospirota bacterium]